MFEGILNFFRKFMKTEEPESSNSKSKAKERLHLVLMQDRANVSADFLEMMKQEIIDVIKKYIVVDESAIDVRLTNQANTDGTTGAPALYANIPIVNIKNEAKGEKMRETETQSQTQEIAETKTESNVEIKEENNNQESLEQLNQDNKVEENNENVIIQENNSTFTEDK